jgi:hypothetical protein
MVEDAPVMELAVEESPGREMTEFTAGWWSDSVSQKSVVLSECEDSGAPG